MKKIENFDMLLYCLNESMWKLERFSMSSGKYSTEETFFIIGTALHWLVDCYERIEKIGLLNESDKIQVSALRFANNCLKHNITLGDFREKAEGATLPILLDGSAELWHYAWKDLDYVQEIQNENQRKNYNKILRGKAIVNTFREDVKKVNDYYKKYISK